VGEAPGLFGAVLEALDSGIAFNVSCLAGPGEPDLVAGEAGVNDRPEGTCGRRDRSCVSG
jgi:hypothetical protein